MTFSYPVVDEYIGPSLLIKGNDNELPSSDQDKKIMDHVLFFRLKKLLSDITNTNCLSNPQSCLNLSYLVYREWRFVNGLISIHYKWLTQRKLLING